MARTASARLRSQGWNATRDGGQMSARDMYRYFRREGATASEAFGLAKGYKSTTSGDYYR